MDTYTTAKIYARLCARNPDYAAAMRDYEACLLQDGNGSPAALRRVWATEARRCAKAMGLDFHPAV